MKSKGSAESDANSSALGKGHIQGGESDGLSARIAALIGDEAQATFAKRCGFGESTLRNYLNGADPSRSRLIAMAEAGGVSLEWLATGIGQRQPKASLSEATLSDRERLAIAVRAVEEGLAAVGKKMLPAKKAELICAAYDLLAEGSPQATAQIIQFIKLAA